jgi:hypothetical protein
VIVAVLDHEVLDEQITQAREHLQINPAITTQQRLNFEMSVRSLPRSRLPASADPQLEKPEQQPEPQPAALVTKPRPSSPGQRPVSNGKIPIAQYSPLAASGGYSQGRMSAWQGIANYFNPRRLYLNQIWEERRQAWLDNAANNMYFWAILGIVIFDREPVVQRLAARRDKPYHLGDG